MSFPMTARDWLKGWIPEVLLLIRREKIHLVVKYIWGRVPGTIVHLTLALQKSPWFWNLPMLQAKRANFQKITTCKHCSSVRTSWYCRPLWFCVVYRNERYPWCLLYRNHTTDHSVALPPWNTSWQPVKYGWIWILMGGNGRIGSWSYSLGNTITR